MVIQLKQVTFLDQEKTLKMRKNSLLTSLGYSKFRLNLNFNNELDKKLVMTFHDNATNDFDIGLEAKPPMITENDAFGEPTKIL